MPYVIASPCIDVNDKSCVEECPVDCIYEGDRKSYINPKECIDCGACEPVCPVEAISQDRRVADGDEAFVEDNARLLPRGAARPRRPARACRAVPARWATSAPTPNACGPGPDARRSPAGRRPRARARCWARWLPAWLEWARRLRPRGPPGAGLGRRRPAAPGRPWTPTSRSRASTRRCCSASTAPRPPATSSSTTCCRSSSSTPSASGPSPTSTPTCTSRSRAS